MINLCIDLSYAKERFGNVFLGSDGRLVVAEIMLEISQERFKKNMKIGRGSNLLIESEKKKAFKC